MKLTASWDSGPDRLDDIMDRLAGHGGIAFVLDQRRMSRVWQDAMQAVGGQRGHPVLQRQPSVLSLLRGADDDQWLVAETLERLRLLEGRLQFGELVALAAGQLCARLDRTLLVASLWRQAGKARQVDEPKQTDASVVAGGGYTGSEAVRAKMITCSWYRSPWRLRSRPVRAPDTD